MAQLTMCSGVARDSGGAVAVSVFSTIISNVLATESAILVPAAVIAAGLPAIRVPDILKALPAGTAAVLAVPGVNAKIAAAATSAWQQSYVHALR